MMSDTTEGKQHHIHKNIYWRRTQSLCTSTHYHIFVAKNKHEATANEKKNKANKHRQLFVCAKHFHWTIFTVLLKPDKKHAKKNEISKYNLQYIRFVWAYIFHILKRKAHDDFLSLRSPACRWFQREIFFSFRKMWKILFKKSLLSKEFWFSLHSKCCYCNLFLKFQKNSSFI